MVSSPREQLQVEVRRPSIRFGVFEVDPAAGELRKQGMTLKVQRQPMLLLLALLERPGELVTREELQRRLWPDGTHVDFERGINKAMNRLREALSDDADTPRYVETLAQRGYRFVAPVNVASIESEGTVAVGETTAKGLSSRRSLLVGAASLGVTACAYLLYRNREAFQAAETPLESIAVLPFQNLSQDRGQDYFADGITDQLITEIAQATKLRVVSRTSSMRFKGGAQRTLPEIGRALGADVLVEGSVAQAGSRVRIIAQLIRARDDRHLWAQTYERELTEVLSLQAAVAADIAGRVQASLQPSAVAAPRPQPRVKAEAYEAYLRANFFFDRPTEAALQKCIAGYQQALEVDPSFARAHAGLAQAYNFVAIFGYRPPKEVFPKAQAAAAWALALDSELAEAHNAVAETKKNNDWDWLGAELAYQRALALNPSYFLARTWYAECLTRMARFDEAIAMARQARQIDPVSTISNTALGMILYRARRFDDAIAACAKALELGPHPNALWFQALSLERTGRQREAVAAMERAVQMSPVPVFQAALGYLQARAGQRDAASRLLKQLTDPARQAYVSPRDIALIFAGLGDMPKAFASLELAFGDRDLRVQELTPEFDVLRNSTQYDDLARRIKARGFAKAV
jgi:TolB-like protein/DNA-binding winged helix-turn-helix (wHTH) protein/Tfp pilus assembly protein PilF